MNEELKPCPFCGSKAKLKYAEGDERSNQRWWCKCTGCDAKTSGFGGSNTWSQDDTRDKTAKQNALACWNRRV